MFHFFSESNPNALRKSSATFPQSDAKASRSSAMGILFIFSPLKLRPSPTLKKKSARRRIISPPPFFFMVSFFISARIVCVKNNNLSCYNEYCYCLHKKTSSFLGRRRVIVMKTVMIADGSHFMRNVLKTILVDIPHD